MLKAGWPETVKQIEPLNRKEVKIHVKSWLAGNCHTNCIFEQEGSK